MLKFMPLILLLQLMLRNSRPTFRSGLMVELIDRLLRFSPSHVAIIRC